MKGLIRENPVLVLILGTCPTLAVTTQASNAIGMGVAATAVLLCSNIAISALRNVIPDKVRIPCYIVLIAGFVTLVEMFMEAYAYSLYQALGIYLSLIVVNCIILGRAEAFASKNTVAASTVDGIAQGLGYTLVLVVLCAFREVFGMGTFFDMKVMPAGYVPAGILTLPVGGFLCLGALIAAMQWALNKSKQKAESKGKEAAE